MTNRYEQRYLIDLAVRISTAFPARSVMAQELSTWIENQDLGFAWDPDVDNFKRKGLPASVWSKLRSLLAERDRVVPRQKPDALARNIAALAAHVGLSSEERVKRPGFTGEFFV